MIRDHLIESKARGLGLGQLMLQGLSAALTLQ
jgi:hypothetical protein